MATGPGARAVGRPPGVPLRLVVLPTEHGSWSFLAEPVLLGMLVAFSWPGVLVAAGAVAAFLARQPLRLWAGDLRRGRTYPRTSLAGAAFAIFGTASVAALATAWWMTNGSFWPALAGAAPLAAVAMWFDIGKRSREMVAELAGAVALGALASAIALAGGMRLEMAMMLWAVLALRTVPTILFVRARLRLERGQRARLGPPLVAHVVAVAAITVIVYGGFAPRFATWAMVLLALRAALGLSPLRPRWKTWQLGVSEVAFGLVTVACVAWGR